MNESLKALDELLATIIRWPMTVIQKAGGSSRLWVTVGTAIGAYLTATQAGLHGTDAIVAAAAVVLTGGSYVISKSVQHVAEAKANGIAAQQAAAQPAAPAAPPLPPPPPPTPPPKYEVPFDVTQFATGLATAFLRWERFEDLRSTLDLTAYNPTIRLEFAKQIEDEEFKRLVTAWNEEAKASNATAVIAYPLATDFDSYDATEQFKKSVMDAIPGCQWVPDNMHRLIIGFGNNYDTRVNIVLLMGKPINWNRINTIADIQREGLKAVYAI